MKLDLQKILKALELYREREVVIDPEHAALLVIDVQNFFHRIVRPVLGNIQTVIQFCRQEDIPIIFTRHGHTDPPSDSGALGSNHSSWDKGLAVSSGGDRRIERYRSS